jgi:hypothetical protein
MKPLSVLFLLLSPLTILSGCLEIESPDEFYDPWYTDPVEPAPPPPPGPPDISAAYYTESAILTNTHGGTIDLRVNMSNAPGAASATNVYADVTAFRDSQPIGRASTSFGTLTGGAYASQYIELNVSAFPTSYECWVTWEDDSGYSYSLLATKIF